MKKLSISLGVSLIALGLLFTGSTNAMTYTVSGTGTQVSIPAGTSEGITINRGDGSDTITVSSQCGEQLFSDEIGEYVYKCSKTYSGGEYNVTISNPDHAITVQIYLNSSNITKISNFNGFSQLNTIYLKNNQINQIDSSALNGLGSNYTIYFDHNNISNFKPSMSDIRNLYLNSNSLTTIPDTIRNARNSTQIKLSNTISYGSDTKSKLADLRNNNIKFVGITKIGNRNTETYNTFSFKNTTTYNFEWFGYSYETNIDNLKYDYTIEGNSTIHEIGISGTGIEITEPLRAGDYTFNVCLNGSTEFCDSKEFSVSYDETITFTSKPNSKISSINNIKFNWTRSGYYPEEFIGGYKYTLKKAGSSTPISNQPTIVDSNSYTLDPSLISGDPNGNYTFTVTLWDTNGVQIGSKAEANFEIEIDDSISIEKPSGLYEGSGVNTKTIDFKWSTSSSLFSYYNYYITTNNTCTSSNIITGRNNVTINPISFSYPFQPGTYLLCITMHNSNGTEKTNNSSFSVNIPSTLNLESPSAGEQPTNNITFKWNGFSPFFKEYEYILSDGNTTTSGTGNQSFTQLYKSGLHHGNYHFTIKLNSSTGTIKSRDVDFEISDSLSLLPTIISDGTTILSSGHTITSRSATFTRSGQSEDLAGFYYEISGTTFKNETYKESGIQTSGIDGNLYKAGNGSIPLSNLQTGKYKFTVKMLAGDSIDTAFHEESIEFYVKVPATLTITSPKELATITSSRVNFSWTGYSDEITRYEYNISKVGDPINQDQNNILPKTSTSFSRDLANGDYIITVWISSGGNLVAEDSVQFTVAIPAPKPSGGSSGKTHYTNNLKLSLGNDSPAANEWIKLIVKIDDSYVGKVTFSRLQHYSSDTEKREDIPVTSKNYVSDYSDDAKLGYIKFLSNDDGRKDLEQFIKFSKNGYYRIYAEDKDGYDTYIEFKVSGKTTQTNTPENNNTNDTNTINTIIQKYIPEVYEDTSEEVYIARSCKKYTIKYSDSLNVYTSPNLNMSEYFISKDYFKRYVDSKNKYQSGCPTNVGWISTSYSDKTNDNSRYTAPNGKVYFITGQPGNYYSDELNKELKIPTSFNSIQELKYYIRDRNPLISMAALGPAN